MRNKNVPDGLNELPIPTSREQSHSLRLIDLMTAEMEQQGGAISFARYMALALYAPGKGYYSAGKRKFGEGGDFITAPEISPLFSHCLALQCQQVLSTLGAENSEILEFGAGSGVMAAHLLSKLAELDSQPRRYLILDVSADLRQRQRQTLELLVPALIDRVEWIDVLPEDFTGVVLANELIDAMPVHRVGIDAHQPYELYVTENPGGEFGWQRNPLKSGRLLDQLESIITELGDDSFCAGYETEINIAAQDWITSIAATMKKGMILLIDYGFPRREYYHPERYDGTLMCHYYHRAHDNALILPGLQDITAHVDFTAIAEAADKCGLEVAGYTSQAQFLLGAGLGQLMQQFASKDIADQLKLSQQIKKLTLPHEMGELFKVMALTRAIDVPLIGFSLNDQRVRL